MCKALFYVLFREMKTIAQHSQCLHSSGEKNQVVKQFQIVVSAIGKIKQGNGTQRAVLERHIKEDLSKLNFEPDT